MRCQPLAGKTFYQNLVWSPDGDWLLAVVLEGQHHTHFLLLSRDGTTQRRLFTLTEAYWMTFIAPQWSADGQQIYYMARNLEGRYQVVAYDLARDHTTPLTPAYHQIFDFDVGPERQVVLLAGADSDSQLLVVRPDGSTRLLERFTSPLYTMLQTVAWSPDGRWLVFNAPAGDDVQLVRLGADGQGRHQLTWSQGDKRGPRWSPDGQWIAFLSTRPVDDVFVVQAHDLQQQAITRTDISEGYPQWRVMRGQAYHPLGLGLLGVGLLGLAAGLKSAPGEPTQAGS